MKKNVLIIFLIIMSTNVIYAQNIFVDNCIETKIDKDYALGRLIYGNKENFYFTLNKLSKDAKYITSDIAGIYKYSHNMKLVSTISTVELFSNLDDKAIIYSPYIVKDNFIFIIKEPVKKNSYKNDEFIYSTVVINMDFNKVTAKKELYKLEDNYREDPRIIYSIDSSSLLITFERWETNTNLAKADIEKRIINIGSNGEILFNKKISFTNRKESTHTLIDLLFDNTSIYMVYKNFVTKKNLGVSPKSGERIKNFHLLKYNTQTEQTKEIIENSDFSNYFFSSARLFYSNSNLYIAGTYYNEVNFMGAYRNGFDGQFLMRLNNKDEVVFSSFFDDYDIDITNKPKTNRAIIKKVFFKSDGGAYVIAEDHDCVSYCNSDEISIINFGNDGKVIWKKFLDKKHDGINKVKGDIDIMYTYISFYNDRVYIILNESKENAYSPIDASLKLQNDWSKEIYCISFIYNNDGIVNKNIIFKSDTSTCKFRANYYNNNLYQDLFNNKIYSKGVTNMLVLKYE
jgi:hypothetical protein